MAKDGRSSSPPSSPAPHRRPRSSSPSRSRRSRSRSRGSDDASNPGNNLYVTGLSSRVTEKELEKYFSSEGKVVDCQLVADPHSKESRGFGFVTMDTIEGAERCIKYLNRSVLEGRLITVQKARRKRGRTPTPGKYQGLTDKRGHGPDRRGSRGYSPRRRYDAPSDHRDRRGARGYSPRRRYDAPSDHGDRRGRSPPPYARREDAYSSARRHRDRS